MPELPDPKQFSIDMPTLPEAPAPSAPAPLAPPQDPGPPIPSQYPTEDEFNSQIPRPEWSEPPRDDFQQPDDEWVDPGEVELYMDNYQHLPPEELRLKIVQDVEDGFISDGVGQALLAQLPPEPAEPETQFDVHGMPSSLNPEMFPGQMPDPDQFPYQPNPALGEVSPYSPDYPYSLPDDNWR
tara:strand:- start:400 stop:948 length:549 start_codon:yes stop_codon:yes gene_type:complete